MKILLAPDSFKGTFSSAEVIEMAAASGIGLFRREEYDPWRTECRRDGFGV